MAENNKRFNSLRNSKFTTDDLTRLQSEDLQGKFQITLARIMEAYQRTNKQCYVSFSGGKDSTVLAYISAMACELLHCKLVLWFSDTGLEFPEVRQHVKDYGEWLKEKFPTIEIEVISEHPKDRKGNPISFRDVILNEGYPLISKEVALKVHDAVNNPNGYAAQSFYEGTPKNIKYPKFKLIKYEYLLHAPFRISHKCCDIMKKRPAKRFEKERHLMPIIGTMACESNARRTEWLKNGCNAFDNDRPISRPMSFWTEQDVLKFIVLYELPYPSVYGEIKQNECGVYYATGYERTGCMYCGFGCHLEKEPNRFQKLKNTHPKIWEYCMKPVENGGLGMKEVLEYIDVDIE